MEDFQKSRIRVTRKLWKEFDQNRENPNLGDILVATFRQMGKGDEYDIGATIIDAITDIFYTIDHEGRSVQVIASAALVNDFSTHAEAEFLAAFRSAYTAEHRGFNPEFSFEDIIRVALGHANIECNDLDVAEVLSGYQRR